jgi:hypothetical protein
MLYRYRIALMACCVLAVGTWGIRACDIERKTPSDACLARLTAIDNPRFAPSGHEVHFDGTLLFRPSSLYVEGTLGTGERTYRLNRQMQWKRRWFSPSSYRLETTQLYLGDGLPADIASQLPVIGEPQIELHFVKLNSWLYGVFSNDVFLTYCRKMPNIDLMIPDPQTPGARREVRG